MATAKHFTYPTAILIAERLLLEAPKSKSMTIAVEVRQI